MDPIGSIRAMNASIRNLETAVLLGMPLPEAAQAVLSGAFGPPPSLLRLLTEARKTPHRLRIASALLTDLSLARPVFLALETLGLHPMSLLLFQVSEDTGYRPRAIPCFPSSLQVSFARRQGILQIRGYQPLEPGPVSGNLVLDPAIELLHVVDSQPEGLFGSEQHLKAGLSIIACEGPIQIPQRIDGPLKVTFSSGLLRFAPELRTRGRVEIRDASGAVVLPRLLEAEGLILDRCPGVRRLPTSLPGLQTLELLHVPIRTIPPGLPNLRSMRLVGLSNLRRLVLPDGPLSELHLEDLPELETMVMTGDRPPERLEIVRCPRLDRARPRHRPKGSSVELGIA